MRIDLNGNIPAAYGSEASSQTSTPSSNPSKTAQGTTQAGDAAQVAWGPASVQALTARVHQLPEMRAERLAALAPLVHEGTYRVTGEQVAEALMAHMARSSTR